MSRQYGTADQLASTGSVVYCVQEDSTSTRTKVDLVVGLAATSGTATSGNGYAVADGPGQSATMLVLGRPILFPALPADALLYRTAKRTLDLLVSGLILLVTFPVTLVIAL